MLGWNDAILPTLASHGHTVHIAHQVLINSPDHVYLGNRVRIDPFTLITTGLETGDNVHILSHVALTGGLVSKVVLNDWSFICYGSKLLCGSDDYSGDSGPVLDYWGHNLAYHGDIVFGPYAGVASNVIVMPGVELPEGCVIGAGSYVPSDAVLEPWWSYWGTPLLKRRLRNRQMILQRANDPAYLKQR